MRRPSAVFVGLTALAAVLTAPSAVSAHDTTAAPATGSTTTVSSTTLPPPPPPTAPETATPESSPATGPADAGLDDAGLDDAESAEAAALPVVPLPTAVVTLGDSYISGEGGRWAGNHFSDYGDRGGTDRAAYRNRWGFWRYSEALVYGPSGASGCHRSDVAPVLSSGLHLDIGVESPVDTAINLACSGAETVNLFRSSHGGQGMKGERSQADKLADVAAGHDIEMVVVSIGGNDLGFGSIILDCALDYMVSNSWWHPTCHASQQRRVDGLMQEAMANVGRALDEIRATLDEAGQGPEGYRLVLQSYPSPVPRGDEFRYSQGSWSRTFVGGCPFWNVDATWARDSFVPQLAANLGVVAAVNGAEFLDLQDALDGREICAREAHQGDGSRAEWSRYLSTGVLQGEAQESLHPNAFGQQAMGRCLQLLFAADPGHHRCLNTPGSGPGAMVLEAIERNWGT